MKKVIVSSLVILGAIFLSGCNQQPVGGPIGSSPQPSTGLTLPDLSGNISSGTLSAEPKKSNFSEISQADQTRIKEIFTGVLQNTISVTPSLKNEFKSIFKKYNATDAEITDFATYGPAFMANYQRLFFTDASQAVSSGAPVKSYERLNLEKEAVSRGLMTSERVIANDEEMKLIASHRPVIGSDGRQIVFSEEIIRSSLDGINAKLDMLNQLFFTSASLKNNDEPSVSKNAALDKSCEDTHGPSIYKLMPGSDGGAYCDCKPGYTLKPMKTAEGVLSSWCTKI